MNRRARPLAALLAICLPLLLLVGCTAYPQNIFQPTTEFARELDDLFNLIFRWALVVFVAVEGVLIYAAIRFRRRPGDALPKQVHGDTRLEILWTAAPAVVLLFVFFPTAETIFRTQGAPPDPNPLRIEVIGHQFWWEFRYPQPDGSVVVTANEVHMPQGKTAFFEMSSADVIHSFWIPALGGKRDVVPGKVNNLWWTPEVPGVYLGQCAELCGYSHAHMRMRGIVNTPQEFEAWIAAQKAPAATPAAGSPAARGAEVFTARGCAGCHAVSGTPATSRVGPDLSHFGSRLTVAAGIMENTPENLRRWLADPPGVKPGALMPNLNLNAEDLDALVAYLTSLK